MSIKGGSLAFEIILNFIPVLHDTKMLSFYDVCFNKRITLRVDDFVGKCTTTTTGVAAPETFVKWTDARRVRLHNLR